MRTFAHYINVFRIQGHQGHLTIVRSPVRYLFMLLLLASSGFGTVNAAHYSGGSITYECLGGNQYLVSLDLFLDCSGVAMIPQSIFFESDCGTQFSVNSIPVPPATEVSQLCPSALPSSTCNGGTLAGIEYYSFQTTVNLPPCNDWTISWSICCRNGTLNLVGTPGMYIEATLNNAGAPCNNSPVFSDQSIPYVCTGQQVNYNFGVTQFRTGTPWCIRSSMHAMRHPHRPASTIRVASRAVPRSPVSCWTQLPAS